MTEQLPIQLTRKMLGEFVKDPRTVRAFENLNTTTDTIAQRVGEIEASPVIGVELSDVYTNDRKLAGGDDVIFTDGGPKGDVTLELTDTGVAADSYGSPTRILVLAIDAKGRVTAASEVKINVSDVDGVLAPGHGGTGLAAYTVGDLLVADGAASLATLPDAAVGNVLKSGGVGVAPLYGKVVLTADVSGILPEANGGTGTSAAGFTGTVNPLTQATFVNGKCTAAS